jgi:hypothetical protein
MSDQGDVLMPESRGEIFKEEVARVCDDLERDHGAFVAELLRLVPLAGAGEVVAELHRRYHGRRPSH